MGSNIVTLRQFVTQYRVPQDVQELFQMNNNGVKRIDEGTFERIKRSAVEKRRIEDELTVIQPQMKRARLEYDWSLGSQGTTISSFRYNGLRSAGSAGLQTSAGSILNSESVSLSKGGSHGSILQSELFIGQDSLVLESSSSGEIINSDLAEAAAHSSPLPEMLYSSG
ncbi:uncharacterized protein Ecym_2062 [Eremothecium cymbalariae DBVPG|uniref:Uncharacterized protein n=1 Tax=Eremothecium cymbalariae (strain CBS 270.75 / DBVPG 7215 / KCTC 17166 / NRRL Y-17582) TaxID=931890 RepID=G8JP19_ERECY|nr:Hypothetical protein Ecym_2062 [Eremothecium cymbalariae DBVPG\